MNNKNKFDIKSLLLNLFIAEGAGILSGFLSGDISQKYSDMIKPKFAPPGILFPIVWAILFFLMGIANYLSRSNKKASYLYFIQLIFNFLWSIFFFGLDLKLFSFFWLIILFVLILATTKEFFKTNFYSGLLMIPYIMWVMFALYLNFEFWRLN